MLQCRTGACVDDPTDDAADNEIAGPGSCAFSSDAGIDFDDFRVIASFGERGDQHVLPSDRNNAWGDARRAFLRLFRLASPYRVSRSPALAWMQDASQLAIMTVRTSAPDGSLSN
jgi:hypothetical protein